MRELYGTSTSEDIDQNQREAISYQTHDGDERVELSVVSLAAKPSRIRARSYGACLLRKKVGCPVSRATSEPLRASRYMHCICCAVHAAKMMR